jgi:23S rRNA (pseudouridine1915-N3)-methyltransferase
MKIECWSIGKQHDPSIKDAIDDYTKRINKYHPVKWVILPVPKNAGMLSEADLKRLEGKMVVEWLDKDDVLVALDERGKEFDSIGLATFLSKKGMEGAKKIVFLIGGAYGVEEEIKKRAQFTWSLSELVFPHMLVRLILAEQVYRACSILANEKYHHQ